MARVSKWLTVALAILVVAAPATMATKESDTDVEKKLGQEAAAEAEKTLKFVTDEECVKRVETIGKELAAIAKTTKVPAAYGSDELADFAYTFRVVDDKEVNAFALPAGYVYVNKGLLDRVESDDELAGVLAHEIAHVAHHHMLKLLRKQSQIDKSIFLLIAAAAIGKVPGSDMQNIFYGAKLFEIAKLNSYSQEAESDADTAAIRYMLKTKYNPVGILTFMEKLARDQAYDPVDPGVFRTHPLSRERADNIIAQLESHEIPIDRRAVSSGVEATARDLTIGKEKVSEVVVGDRVVIQLANTLDATSAERARAIAEQLNSLFRLNPKIREVRLSHDGTAVYIKEQLVVDVRPADAKLTGISRESLAMKAKESIQAAVLSEEMQLMY